MTDKSLRDRLAKECMKEYIAKAEDGRLMFDPVFSGFCYGWDACEKELSTEVKHWEANARENTRKKRTTHDVLSQARDRWKEMAGKLAMTLWCFDLGNDEPDQIEARGALKEFEKMRDGK